MDTALVAQLDAGRGHDCEYGEGLSNHLPMALIALDRLGADARRRQAFEATYATRLPAAPAAVAWPDGDAWASRLGDRSAYAAYRDLFGRWRLDEGAGAVLAQVLPPLMRGCGGAAFHGLIRTAYGVSSRHAGELVSGLAYWACRFMPLFDLPATSVRSAGEPDPEALLRCLTKTPSDAGLIAERMRHAARVNRDLPGVASALQVDAGTLETLARLAARAYAHSGNFAALHLVTSAHALRVLLPFIDEPLAAVRHYWQAFVTAVVIAELEPRPVPSRLPWSDVMARACASSDEHVVKLVDSAREQEAAYGGAIWSLAASRAVG
jgi:Questin oxidase-like